MRYAPIDAKRGYELSLPGHTHDRSRKWWLTCAAALAILSWIAGAIS